MVSGGDLAAHPAGHAYVFHHPPALAFGKGDPREREDAGGGLLPAGHRSRLERALDAGHERRERARRSVAAVFQYPRETAISVVLEIGGQRRRGDVHALLDKAVCGPFVVHGDDEQLHLRPLANVGGV